MWQITTGGITKPQGFLASGVHAGFKKKKLDLALITCKEATAAGVYTQNAFAASPVKLTKKNIAQKTIKAIVINSGNANACTGEKGTFNALLTTKIVAEQLGIKPNEVAVASTGVIGLQLDMDLMKKGIVEAVKKLSKDGAKDAATAIMTTDTYPKEIAAQCNIEGTTYTISGMAKGSGMIHPNMATMLCFLTTDWPLETKTLQSCLKEAVEHSFNAISVDGDTSTNDMCLLLASQLLPRPDNKYLQIFQQGLQTVTGFLAKAIVLDGEGATKLLKITVKNAQDIPDAKLAAKAIAHSPLVKTAFFGEDANWGRILCAVGYSGCKVDPDRISLYLDDFLIVKNGQKTAVEDTDLLPVMQKREIGITVDLNLGSGEYSFQTTDLSYDYVKINGSYRS